MEVHGCGFHRYDARIDEGIGRQVDCAHEQEVSYRILHPRPLENGEIVEEKLFFDLVGLLKQIGVM